MNNIAYLFPGQGAQYPGMGKDFAASYSIAKETFEEADDILGEKISRIIFDGPEETLTQTKYSQPALFITSIAILRTLEQQIPEIRPSVCSGLSLGEYSALCASGRVGFRDALLLVRQRACFMNDACERTSGTMAAVLGLDAAEIEALVQTCEGVWIANYNCPGQIVISGTKTGVEAASRILKEKGAKRVLPLTVHGAFHSGLMQSAQDNLAPFIADAAIGEGRADLVMNVPGGFVVSPEDIRRYLIEQITNSVRWEQGIRAMQGVRLFLEIGCGRTLAGLNKKINPAHFTQSLDKVEDLEKVGVCTIC